MTKEEIAVLGHAFFDGKTLQYLPASGSEYLDWILHECPSFSNDDTKWRIKPDEPKTITFCTFISDEGTVFVLVSGSEQARRYKSLPNWTHIKSLDQVVEVE